MAEEVEAAAGPGAQFLPEAAAGGRVAVEGAGAALRIHGLLWVDGLSHAKSCRRALCPTLRVSSEKLLACASRCLGSIFTLVDLTTSGSGSARVKMNIASVSLLVRQVRQA